MYKRQVYADTNALIDAGIDIVVVKSTQNQYFMGSRLFEYPELKMLTLSLIHIWIRRMAARSAPCRAARRSTSIRSFRFMRTSWTINWNMIQTLC